jgi:hypothetical protein
VANFVLVYRGGSMPEGEAEQQAVMTQWMNWFGSLGDSMVDGGNPFGPSSTVSSNGTVKEGSESALTGYSIISAGDLPEACSKAKGCPVLISGGSIEVYEAMPIG